jgi:hypothetical protein
VSANQIVWKLCSPKGCDPGWWDAECGAHYAGWSVAKQCRVRVIGHCTNNTTAGWYVFKVETSQKVGPFDTSDTAKESCPITVTVKTLHERN